LYGIIFPDHEEAAFSNYRLWESVGFIISYLNTNLLCIKPKLIFLLAVLCIGTIGYLFIEIHATKRRKQMKVEVQVPNNNKL